MDALPTRVALAAARLRSATHVAVHAHASADGIAGAAILRRALERLGVEHGVAWVQDPAGAVPDPRDVAVWVDFGGARPAGRAIVCDHHAFAQDHPWLLHPSAFGLDGASLSGAGMTYLLARALDPANSDAAWLGVVGALAELQDVAARRLVGPNRDHVLHDAQAGGSIEARLDLRARGRDTLRLPALLARLDDPPIPGLLGDEPAAAAWLAGIVPLRAAGRPRRWADLAPAEQRRVLAALATHLLRAGHGAQAARRLVGEVYVLTAEPMGPLRDAGSFADLLAALAGRGECGLALELASGARGPVLQRALRIAADAPPSRLPGVVAGAGVQHVDVRGVARPPAAARLAETLYGRPGVLRDQPLVAFARADDGSTAISAIASSDARRRGYRVGSAVGAAAAAVHGRATGDDHAAEGAIPAGSEDAFLRHVEARLALQAADAPA